MTPFLVLIGFVCFVVVWSIGGGIYVVWKHLHRFDNIRKR